MVLRLETLPLALAVAVAAAQEAGDLLRQEFLRPGGPRGDGRDAPVDRIAEERIRAHLLRFAPDTGYVGEETGIIHQHENPWTWHVDPNDGTRAFLQGYRDTACSIGLVRHGEPVAGVVYAPLLGRSGELFTWFEGGRLERNGVPVNGRPLRRELRPDDRVLVSYDADDAPAAFAKACAPARFSKTSSIALRLAMVATESFHGVVSNFQPSSWDLAGGHALLRGSGNELFDESAQPVRYTGRQPVAMRVFAGSASTIDLLRNRSWRNLPSEEPGPLGPILTPCPGSATRDGKRLERAAGALIGFAIGDWLGTASCIACSEERGCLRGQPTGWTEALWIAAQLRAEGETARARAAGDLWTAWTHSGQCFRVDDRLCEGSDTDLVREAQRTAIEMLSWLSGDEARLPSRWEMLNPSLDRNIELAIEEGLNAVPETSLGAAVAGAVWGAAHGWSTYGLELARLVATARSTGGPHARPRAVWPVNAPHLAERLIATNAAPQPDD